MKELKNRILSLLLSGVIIASLIAVSGAKDSLTRPNDDIVCTTAASFQSAQYLEENTLINKNAIAENISGGVFPMFSNTVDYSRGGATSADEEYPDYNLYTEARHEYTDMIDHKSEVSAVRLAQLGVFAEVDSFEPDSSMTVGGFLKALMMVCGQDINGSTTNAELETFIESTNFLEEGIEIDCGAVLTKEQMAYFLSRATKSTDNFEQYKPLISDYEQIAPAYRTAVLSMVKLGLIEIENYTFEPTAAAKRSDIADGLYRLINTGARLIPPYDIGGLYSEGKTEYLVKTVYETNQAGTMFGFFSNYNHQAAVFENFGKLPIDRTGFNKWAMIEKSEGVYTWPAFSNDAAPHRLGQTSIICVDISANLVSNPEFGASNIPEFYAQDITDAETRAAAKKFLYSFVQQMLSVVGGDVLLLIDYELDWQQAIYLNENGLKRAEIFSDWFVEACGVAREAAQDLGLGGRLKLGVNYNNITGVHTRGVSENQWMLDMAEAVDYVTLDSYQFYDDKTDPSYLLQNMRFLMNNYSLGKPIMVVENGLSINLEDLTATDEVTGLTQTELANQYWGNLFREYRFALERGDFLNANLSAYLIWSYNTGNTAIADSSNKLYPWGEVIKRGINLLYRQNQFNPSYTSKITEFSQTSRSVTVSSGTEYEKLTYVLTDYTLGTDAAKLNIELSDAGTVFVTVNGTVNVVGSKTASEHSLDITEGMRNGLNVIEIYFGAANAPSVRTVNKISLSGYRDYRSSNSIIIGDADDNSQVDIRDLIRTKKYVAQATDMISLNAVDFYNDKNISADDILMVKKILLGVSVAEPVVNSEWLEDTYTTQ